MTKSRPALALALTLTLTPALTLALALALALAPRRADALRRPRGFAGTKPYVDFYTGERLAMGSTAIGSAPSRVSTCGAVATGLPIASTPVGSRSPVTALCLA